MKSLLDDVAAFHRACDVPVLDRPTIPPQGRVLVRRILIDATINQKLFPAMDNGDLPAIAEGVVYAIHALIGTALEYGIPLDQIWAAAQEADMAIANPATGKIVRSQDGKMLKPAGWKPPDVAAILAEAVMDAREDSDLNRICDERTGQRSVKIPLDEL